jgi:hypothetical protein
MACEDGSTVPELHEILAAHQGSGYVVAPAGFGKTYLIAASVSHSTGRQLILTHTYAGVNALRRKMRELKVNDRSFHIDTIASWALRLSLSYPGVSGWTIERPEDAQWTELYHACSRLLDCGFMRRVIQASYSGLYVDEYQDCSTAQHEIVLKLTRNLPCRILGDPLQGIFDFDGQTPVDWDRDIATAFESLGVLDTPHRWVRAGAPAIGTWLRAVRQRLEQGQAIDLTQTLPAGVTFRHANDDGTLMQTQGNICRYFNCDRHDTVIAIHKGSQEYKAKCHTLARNLSGRFSSIEEIEGNALFSFFNKIGRARSDAQRLKTMIAFAGQCMTAVNANLPAATLRGEVAVIRANTRNSAVALTVNAYLAVPSSTNMNAFFTAVKALDGVELVRADLFNRALGVLLKHMTHPQLTLAEAADKYHGEFRYKGRPVGHRKIVGTTLLVKGLEFDHAIVLDASSLRKKELYVALTRGAKSLTIISTATILNPQN